MKQQSVTEMIAEARAHSTGNRKEIEASKWGECFSCCGGFRAKEVTRWKDEWTSPERQNRVPRWSAVCPECGMPTVIGDASGLLGSQHYTVVLKSFINERHA